MFDVVRIISSKQQIFSVRSSPHPPIFKKIAVRSSPDPAKIGFSPDPCTSLLSRETTFVEFVPKLGISATFGEKFGEFRYLGIF